MTFSYKYQRIVDIREVQQKAVELEVHETRTQLSAVELSKQEIIDDLHTLYNEKEQKQLMGIRVQELQNYEAYQLYISNKLKVTQNSSDQLKNQLVLKEERLLTVSQETKKWDRLKENAYATHSEHQKRLEQKALDELTTTRFQLSGTK